MNDNETYQIHFELGDTWVRSTDLWREYATEGEAQKIVDQNKSDIEYRIVRIPKCEPGLSPEDDSITYVISLYEGKATFLYRNVVVPGYGTYTVRSAGETLPAGSTPVATLTYHRADSEFTKCVIMWTPTEAIDQAMLWTLEDVR
jgi:hypothetical protein